MVTRRINPAGFVLVLLLFLLLPFVSMTSWDFPDFADERSPLEAILSVSSTGANIAVHQSDYRWPIAIRLLAIVTLLVMATGVGTALARPARRRPLYAAITASLAGALLVATGLWAVGRMEDVAREFLSVIFSTIPKSESAPLIDQARDAAGLEAGFWLALAVLALIAALNLAVLLQNRRRRGAEPDRAPNHSAPQPSGP